MPSMTSDESEVASDSGVHVEHAPGVGVLEHGHEERRELAGDLRRSTAHERNRVVTTMVREDDAWLVADVRLR